MAAANAGRLLGTHLKLKTHIFVFNSLNRNVLSDMGDICEEIRLKIGGKWELDRSENFEAALEAMGLNVIFRKLASHSKPSMEILVEDDNVKIIARASFFTQTMVLPLDKPYEEEFEGIKMNCTTKWENDKLITEANPVEPSKHKPQKFQRERVNDELVQTMWIGDVVCTRVFKQLI